MNIGGVNNKINVNGIITGSKQKTKQTDEAAPQESADSPVKRKRKSQADKFEEMQLMYQQVMQQLETANAQAKAQGDEIETRIKCLKIAMRIMCGDKVHPADYKYLAEHDISLFAKAIMMRREKENPEEHGRISEDDEGGVESPESGGRSGSASVETAQSEGGEVPAEAFGEAAAGSESE